MRKQCGFSNRTFKIGFDDQSLQPFDCQASFNGETFQPMKPLSIFEGETVEGIWTLEVADSVVGSGGRIDTWSLELCGALAPQSPAIIQLDTLLAQYAGQTILDRQVVEITDDIAGPDDLLFTLVTLPLKGILQVNGDPITVGSQFSQQDINAGQVTYLHTGTDSLPDAFIVTVIDGQGGWIGPLSVPIDISADIVAAHDFQLEGFKVYPNPSQNVLYLNNAQMHGGEAIIRILGVDGVEVKRMTRQLEELLSINLNNLTSGIYFLQLTTREGIANLRFIKA
ncbi:MAG: T9SS type A sorting domain-containing protein [Saprospiraceae bacterium]|nr:T9SS type A sorting domain-containing protein [Saprospiraceae bacterium]